MARLPAPIVTEIKVAWSKEYKTLNEDFNSMLGRAIRKAELKEKRKEGEKREN